LLDAPRNPAAGAVNLASLENLFGRAPQAVAVAEGDAHVLLCVNSAFCRMMGVTAHDIVGKPYVEALNGVSAHGSLELLDHVFHTGEPVPDQELTSTPGGSPRGVWSYTIWPLAGTFLAARSVVMEIRDRTDSARSRERLEELTTRIRQVNERLLSSVLREQESADLATAAAKSKANFLAMMSHELRTPLTGIVAYTELLMAGISGPTTERQQENLRRIEQCSTELLELIDGVLSFARAEANGGAPRLERVDVSQIAREAAEVVEPLIARKGLDFHVLLPTSPIPAVTDARNVRQILLNLLSNALKFTERGEIRLEVRRERGAACLRVTDTGGGIARGDLDRIFEPFVQSEPILTRRYGGTGLGLAISRALAQLLGGTLTAQSSLGEGSTFVFRLPLLEPGDSVAN
jgi:signal transduction histidine kinase